jgi:hypothetical protein
MIESGTAASHARDQFQDPRLHSLYIVMPMPDFGRRMELARGFHRPTAGSANPFTEFQMRTTLLLTILLGIVSCDGGQQHDDDPAWARASSFGVADMPAEEAIGEVTDVAEAESGQIALLDAKNQRVSLLDAAGHLLSIYERSGAGPGEFQVPAALTYVGDSLIVVADRANRRLTALAVSADTLSYAWDVPIDHESRDLCALADRMVVLGDRDQSLLHFYAFDGTYISSSTKPQGPLTTFPEGDPNRSRLLGTGSLYCDADHERLLLAVAHFGHVRILNASGSDLASADVPEFVSVSVEPNGRGGVSWRYPEGVEAVDRIVGIAQSEGMYWIQIRREFDRATYPDGRIEYVTATLSADDFVPTPPRSTVLLEGVWDGPSGLITARSEPYPQLVFVER